MRQPNRVFAGQETTIFTVVSAWAEEFDAVNLGQGFPDGEGPDDLRAAAARYLIEGPNQYPPMAGVPALRQALAEHEARFYGLTVDWATETLVTSGGTEALTASIMALIEPGDEAILIEPAYDCYRPIIEAMGGTVRPVRLTPPDWTLPVAELRAAVTPRTKLLMLNSPMNPIGKVFTRTELDAIADVAVRQDAYVICDEVYEHLVFTGHTHIPLITLPGMDARTVRVGSAGKTFSLTGWKVGYAIARAPLLSVIAKAHQFITFTTPPALQRAVADGLAKDDGYFADLAAGLERRRDILGGMLEQAGLQVLPSEGTYFITADIGALAGGRTDYAFCRWLVETARVAALPLSPFYVDPSTAPQSLIRFCFCKDDAVLAEAGRRLAELSGRSSSS